MVKIKINELKCKLLGHNYNVKIKGEKTCTRCGNNKIYEKSSMILVGELIKELEKFDSECPISIKTKKQSSGKHWVKDVNLPPLKKGAVIEDR